ncbi:NADPH-dependent F420 reductase [Arthrobacter sp. B2a2-09]|uniref:NADPH-dependent F420 reductase n=1 Tax=Arthrobacter sp. B2a2-09 TaxID=2952822 RepID=UPI0022CDA8FD|nr:NAD(P)-binding domain-containing protein [Arthrobacter sp. B2a2-09]MCZ9881188.1 NAD(P)-binding domain-containing protein [Arthrobacter sp. B2a2-09]
MTTAIIGIGNIGSRVARNLVQGGEPVVLAARDQSGAASLAAELGPLASSASVADAVSQADAVLMAVWLDTEKELISDLSQKLVGKVVIDPTNPIGPDGRGGYTNTLAEGESAASIVANLLPAGVHFVKAFGSLGADALGSAANRPSGRAVLFYATDDDAAAETVERLITAAGFDPVKAGGIEAAGRLELMRGDLHQNGGLGGKLLNADEARAAL